MCVPCTKMMKIAAPVVVLIPDVVELVLLVVIFIAAFVKYP